MSWPKENPFLAGLIGASVVILGGLGYFAYSNYGTYSELQGVYQGEVEKLHGLQNKTPFPSAENLQKIKESQAAYQEALNGLSKSLDAYQLPLNREISPQQFQDELRKTVSLTQSKATEADVKLPDDFYLGFDLYRASLPSQEAAPYLSRQLTAIEAIVNGLIETKVANISQFARASLPTESAAARPAAGPNTPSRVEKNLLDITFSGDQARVRLAVNSLLASPQFLIVRALKIQNSATSGPGKISGTAENSAKPVALETGGKQPEALNMLFGRETIAAQVRIELLEFEKSESANPEKSK